jgi:plasmid stabilization system protein ParE
MARQVIWSLRAQADRKDIFNYWNKRNKTNLYSIKLNALFKAAVKLIAEYPEIGKPTNDKNARFKIVRDYLIFYELNEEDELIILTIWDSRQNPRKLEKILQK